MTTATPRRLRKERVQMVMEAALAAGEKRGATTRARPAKKPAVAAL